jgi:hypothetical protein
MKKIKAFVFSFLFFSLHSCAQSELSLKDSKSGLRLFVINTDFPLLKALIPGQPDTDRGIEIEFPEHVTGLNTQRNAVEHLYLVSRGNANRRTVPVWKKDGNTLIYETLINGNIRLIAKAKLDSNAITYSYTFTNLSDISYQNLQAVTCVKLYSVFSDTLLERTYVHHADGFDLLASETPQRLTMPLDKWLPCRYLVSYRWPVAPKKIDKGEDSITRYYKSKKADEPFIATYSHDKKWIAATYTAETGNLWTNPERTCQHADPSITLNAHETKSLVLKTFLFKGSPEMLLKYIAKEQKQN